MITLPLKVWICRESRIDGSLIRILHKANKCGFLEEGRMCRMWETETGGNRKPCDAKEAILNWNKEVK